VEQRVDAPGHRAQDHDAGNEWYVMRNGRIAEVRAYFIADPGSDAELATFPYAERGYMTVRE
jgi:hypothetical protein